MKDLLLYGMEGMVITETNKILLSHIFFSVKLIYAN